MALLHWACHGLAQSPVGSQLGGPGLWSGLKRQEAEGACFGATTAGCRLLGAGWHEDLLDFAGTGAACTVDSIA